MAYRDKCYGPAKVRCTPRFAAPPCSIPEECYWRDTQQLSWCFDDTPMTVLEILDALVETGEITADQKCLFLYNSSGLKILFGCNCGDTDCETSNLRYGVDPIQNDDPLGRDPSGKDICCDYFLGSWEFGNRKIVAAEGAGPVCVNLEGVSF